MDVSESREGLGRRLASGREDRLRSLERAAVRAVHGSIPDR